MSLKIKGWKKITKWTICSILSVLLLAFFIKVAIWEHNYYGSKEGSERATASGVERETEELIEVEPTEEEVTEYTVAPDRPRYLTIDKLGIDRARIISVGVNSEGELGTPNNIFDVGWYEASGKPGQGGTMLIDGHNGGPHVRGVFKDLPDLEVGDIIKVERGDGVVFRYSVVENKDVALKDSDRYMSTAMKTPEIGKESISLISCTGEWSDTQKTYLSRQFVRAVLMVE